MKKYILKTIMWCSASMLMASCSLLDTHPQDFTDPKDFYKTEEQLDMALNGVYATLAEGSLYGNNMLGRMGLSADIGYESYSTDEGTVGYHDVFPTDSKVLIYWRDLYKGIGNANMLLEYLHQPLMDERARDDIKGQALFLRAYYHFMLVTRFNNIPLILKVPASGMAQDVQVAQSPARETYLRIIKDMEDAALLVRVVQERKDGGRVSQSTVYGMLAKVALYMAGEPVKEPGMYAKAKEYAAKVIDINFHALNPSYQQVFINYIQDKYDLKESIWEVEFYGSNVGTYTTTAGMVGRNNGIGFSNEKMEHIGVSIGTIRATPYFYGLFGNDDLRRDWTISPYTYNSETGEQVAQTTNFWIRYCGKFRREYELSAPKSVSFTPINFPLLRYADVLLMYAEGVVADPDNNDATEITKAYECVNMVRRRGYGKDIYASDPAVDIANEGKMTLMDVIKDERARELGHELLRKDDIVRWGEFYTRMQFIAESIPADFTSSYYVAARIAYNSAGVRDALWPIPTYEMGVNRKLVQNKGW